MNRKKLITNVALALVLASSSIFVAPERALAETARLGGANRYETSVAVSKSGWTSSKYVILANGESYADALCAAPLAKKLDAPILLTPKNTLDSSVKSEIARLKATDVIEMGGTGVISSSVENQLKGMSVKVERIGGSDRYQTSIYAAEKLGSIKDVVIASGEGYADALSIAPVAAAKGYPILLTSKNSVPKSVQNYIDKNKASIEKSYIIGGEGVISGKSAAGIGSSTRIYGSDRYETNVSVIDYFKNDMKFDKVYLAYGNGFADALASSSIAAKTSSPVFLAYKTLNKNTAEFMKSNLSSDSKIVAVGGTASVSNSLLTEAQNAAQGKISGGSSSGGSSSSSDIDALKSASSKIKAMDLSGLDAKQKQIISDMTSTIDKYTSDTSYNYKDDVNKVKSEYNLLSNDKQNQLKDKLVNSSKMSISEMIKLKEKFDI